VVAREVAYYKANIGKVKKPEDLLADTRLYTYAMKAFGLEDMTYAKAFMKKVLESDLTNTDSFANKLTDSKYKAFAASFNFATATKVAQTGSQEDATIGLYSNSITREDSQVVEDTAYYNIQMDTVTTVDAFLTDSRLRTYALKSLGIDPNTNVTHLRDVLTSDLSDPNSYANQLPEAYPNGVDANGNTTYTAYPKQTFLALAAAFNFKTDGTLADGKLAQDATQKKAVTDAYNLSVPSHITPTAQQMNVDYLKAKMANVTKVSDLTDDSRLFNIVKTALGLPGTFLGATFENIVNSDLSDPQNYAVQQGGETYVAIARLFNFQTDSTVTSGKTAMDDSQMASLVAKYQGNYNKPALAQKAADDAYYKVKIATMSNVQDLINDSKLYTYTLKAYGIDPAEVSPSMIKTILTTDLTVQGNYVARLNDTRFTNLANGFNFDASGKIALPKLAQSENEILQISKDYVAQKSRFLTGTAQKAAQTAATAEASYYSSAIEKVKSVTDLLADSRIVKFMLTAKGIDPAKVTTDYLTKIFASNLDDPKSFANTETDTRFRDLAASFNFDTSGKAVRPSQTNGQSRADLLSTAANYLQQTLEENAGADNEGVRLALYFKRMAPNFRTAYDILADPALVQVFRTAFSMSSSMSSMDVTRQADIINAKLNLKDLQDPANLEKFIARFTALHDLANDSGSYGNAAISILSGNTSSF
ncbi:MAG: hypothetical protein RIR97_927, partial [Pseudomonadota bacterium]